MPSFINYRYIRYINISYYFIKELIINKIFKYNYILIKEIVINDLIKLLILEKFVKFIIIIELNNLELKDINQ